MQQGRSAGIAMILKPGGHAGMGIVVSPRHVLTCAHVINTAIERQPEDEQQPEKKEVEVVFPLGDGHTRIGGTVVAWTPMYAKPVADVAVLELKEDVPENVGIAILGCSAESLDDHPLKVFGYRADEGNHVDAKFMGPTSATESQIDGTSVLGVFVEGGFSGAAVWDMELEAVVGMVVAKNINAADRVAYMLGLPPVQTIWPSLKVTERRKTQAWNFRSVPVSGVEQMFNPMTQGNLAYELKVILNPEDKNRVTELTHREEELEFLKQMELFIRTELRKSGDEEFVELSMRLADPSAPRQMQLDRSFSLAFGEIEKKAPIIPSLVGLGEALAKFGNLVLLGGPGSGKTTVLQHLALRMIGDYRDSDQRSNLLPVYLPLTKYVTPEPTLDLVQRHIAELVGPTHFVAQNCHALARFKRLLLILDGLDQMPNRRSETIRLERLRRLESDLRRVDQAVKIVRMFGQKKAEARLIQGRQAVSDQIAPTVDLREQYIEKLPSICNSPVITSCRMRDFVGSPRWQSLVVLEMDADQVREFVQKYSPQALEAVEKQWQTARGTRGLIGNPFYLRMLTQALKRRFDEAESQEFRRAAAKRGRLLEFLLHLGLQRELAGRTDLTVDDVLDRLGQLAYSMLQHNIIGAVPQEALTRWLGEESSQILKVAEDVNLLTVREGLPASVDFNHQLFLEFLLALHLKKKRETEGGFQEGLLLLAHRGDRWAETMNLLFELVPDDDRNELVSRFVEALKDPATWDIATRVLAGIGDAAAPSLAELLSDEDDLARQGAAKVLGKIGATQYVQDLAALRGDRSWRVRREAVDALVVLKQSKAVDAFVDDEQPSVVRSVFRGQLQLCDAPGNRIRQVVQERYPIRQTQMAWAMHDLFTPLSNRLSEAEMATLLRDLLDHTNHDVKVLAYLMVSQASDSTKRSLKRKLMKGALDDDDVIVNCVARQTVSPFLTADDIETLQRSSKDLRAEQMMFLSPEQRRAMRALSLLAEARQKKGPQDVLDHFVSAQPAEIALLTQRLAAQADPTSLSLLMHLIGQEQTSAAAIGALVGAGGEGTSYLLAGLEDSDPAVQLNAARFLSFCKIPRIYARKVRLVLHREGVHSHVVRPVAAPNMPAEAGGCTWMALTTLLPFGSAFFFWAVLRTFGIRVPYSFWLRYHFTNFYPTLFTLPNVDPLQVTLAERQTWIGPIEEPKAKFWLARGRLLRLAGSVPAARKAINKSLHLEPEMAAARYEMAILERAGGNLDGAKRVLEAEDRRFIESGTALEALDQLLELDERGGHGAASAADTEERARLLVRLGLWKEALPAVKALFGAAQPPDAYLLLYRCYVGAGETRRALAAAAAHNGRAGAGIKVPAVEIDNLAWFHREESFPASTRGTIEMMIDLHQRDEALAMLRDASILPDESEPLDPHHIQRLRGLDPALLDSILGLLAELGKKDELSAISAALESED